MLARLKFNALKTFFSRANFGFENAITLVRQNAKKFFD
jgi:hypothetical protein